ncbi:MAG: hypothetical protein ACYDER_20895 [Ktedonobacteraceae bacterium]
MAGTININVDELITLLQYLLTLKQTLDNEQALIPSLTAQLDAAITGTAPSIAAFDSQFANWAQLLSNVTADMDQAYSALNTVLLEAENAIRAL